MEVALGSNPTLEYFRWMDGSFVDLEAETIEGEVDEYWRELYKIQKLFNNKMKRLQAEREERERDRKKRKKYTEGEEGGGDKPEPEVTPPAALGVCNVVQDNMRDFKVTSLILTSHSQLLDDYLKRTKVCLGNYVDLISLPTVYTECLLLYYRITFHSYQ